MLPVQDPLTLPDATQKTHSLADLLPVPLEVVERHIYLIRGQKVILDADLRGEDHANHASRGYQRSGQDLYIFIRLHVAALQHGG